MGAVVFRSFTPVLGLRDSKLLTAHRREQLSKVIYQSADCGIGVVGVEELNRVGLATGLELAAGRAIACLGSSPDYCVFDGGSLLRDVNLPQTAAIGGDQHIRCVAAASVIAKVYRDQLMRDLHESEPSAQVYRFDLNKGYPSLLHRQQLRLHNPSVHHRTFFRPIAEFMQSKLL